MPQKGEYVKFNSFERKIKPPFIVYSDLESILVPQDNEKDDTIEFYTKK